MIFNNIRTDFNYIFGQFSVARMLILNGGVIRSTGLLFNNGIQGGGWGPILSSPPRIAKMTVTPLMNKHISATYIYHVQHTHIQTDPHTYIM